MKKAVLYFRVSTTRQEESGHGISAQRRLIASYLSVGEWEVLGEFVETESGKRDNRPILKEALHLCQITGATLVVSKLDRLARSTAFITGLQKTGVPFIAADLPEANSMMIQMLAVIGEYERKLIAERTKAALRSAKERGVYFCNKRGRMTLPLGATALNNLNPAAAARGRVAASEAIKAKADTFAAAVIPMIKEYISKGSSLSHVASRLNESNIMTPRKKRGAWTAQAVKNVIKRGGGAAPG